MAHDLKLADELDAERLARLMMAALIAMKALHGIYWPARAVAHKDKIRAVMAAERCEVIEAAWVLHRRYVRLNWPVSMLLAAAAELATEPKAEAAP